MTRSVALHRRAFSGKLLAVKKLLSTCSHQVGRFLFCVMPINYEKGYDGRINIWEISEKKNQQNNILVWQQLICIEILQN
jgi:hypothetical protein